MTLADALSNVARQTPDTIALICDGTRVSYRELDLRASQLAAWFHHRGLRHGDRVAIHWFNSVEAVMILFACWRAGLIAVPVNVRLKATEVAYVLSHSQSAMCFAQPELANVMQAAIEIAGANILLETKLPQLDDISPAYAEDAEVRALDDAAILYTSGTTARPKGVTHTHASLLHCAGFTLSMVPNAGSIWMATTQLGHISGMVCMLLPAIIAGATVALLPAFNPARALDLIEAHRVTLTIGLPAMIAALVEEQTMRPRRIVSLQAFLAGGDTVPVLLQERFEALTGIPVLELIGMTESCPISWNTADDLRPGTVGKPRQGVEVKIVPLAGATEGEGELIVRSPGNFRAYWQDPEATAAVLRDGWLHSGDLMRQDADGFLWFRGRLKQVIVRGGSNISPQEVEEALLEHPAVFEAGVIGLPDATYGQKVGAFLALRQGMTVSHQELCNFAASRLADYKLPANIWFLPELPKGITGKVDRRALTETALSGWRSSTAAGTR